jgi:hypothetical protein
MMNFRYMNFRYIEETFNAELELSEKGYRLVSGRRENLLVNGKVVLVKPKGIFDEQDFKTYCETHTQEVVYNATCAFGDYDYFGGFFQKPMNQRFLRAFNMPTPADEIITQYFGIQNSWPNLVWVIYTGKVSLAICTFIDEAAPGAGKVLDYLVRKSDNESGGKMLHRIKGSNAIGAINFIPIGKPRLPLSWRVVAETRGVNLF